MEVLMGPVRRYFLSAFKFSVGLILIIFFVSGCLDEKAGAKKAVEALLRAALAKDFAKVRQVIDFSGIIDNSIRMQNAEPVDSAQKEKIIDEMVASTCELSKEDLEKALLTLRVEMVGETTDHALAFYDTTKRTHLTLSLEKRKNVWIVTGIG
jgi:PBP1b-binding outer membrane lipoprotein LpoB